MRGNALMLKRLKRLFCLFTAGGLVLFLTGFGFGNGMPDRLLHLSPINTTGQVYGIVTVGGQPVGATVRVFRTEPWRLVNEIDVNNKGYFNLTLVPGSYNITATTRDEQVVGQSSIVVRGCKFTTVHLTLDDAALVTGVIRDKEGRAVENARLIFASGQSFVSSPTANKGEFSVSVPSRRTYNVYTYPAGMGSNSPVIITKDIYIGAPGWYEFGELLLH
ncbi:MAG TPA: carboxypeptidase regulatory-like domain-containing protein [Desulfotomaculum sp.]|nr:MAG: hypothetical protein JL56_03790 [Desulfotomaculum sp. BICA1-6]HBX22912.1 carboxypeptidase regulatory-like domain-containing protein [Desulfotomaculum sp.]